MKIGFIGSGKMALALAQGLLKAPSLAPVQFTVCGRSATSRQKFSAEIPSASLLWVEQPQEVPTATDLTILAVKPKDFPALLPLLAPVSAHQLFVSIAAGLTLKKIESALASNARVIRAMPNTPCLVGQGVTAYAGGQQVTAGDYQVVQQILSAVGHAVQVEESQLNAVTALSGSGPAYIFEIMEALMEAGVAQGLPVGLARTLVIHTVLGSAEMVKATNLDPLDLAAQVKSPGGTTEAGCEVLATAQLATILQDAVAAAKARADELSQTST